MKPSDALKLHSIEIRNIVMLHHAKNPRVFGSVLHGEDTERSDLDLLIDTTNETTLFDLGAIYYKLHKLLGIKVDVITPKTLPDSFREKILAEAEAI